MKRRVLEWVRRGRALLRDQSGQAMTEYASITTILLLSGIAAGATWPYTRQLFGAIQIYIDFYFFCLNLAAG